MREYTGYQYLLIDAANQYGKDKDLFEERIQWATDNIGNLEMLADQAETYPLYMKAVMAIRKAQAGIPTGHLVGLDACCSGIQVMSVMTGCVEGARSTGLIDPDVRADAYGRNASVMSTMLGSTVSTSRKDSKNAVMTSFYGSKEQPKQIYGEDTPELNAFYQAVVVIAPGAWGLLQDLLASWQPYALSHSWKLPDGGDARVKVMKKMEARIEVDELDHATFTYEFYENQGERRGLSNVANLTHSMDAWILRSMHRRCNYDREVVEDVHAMLDWELIERTLGQSVRDETKADAKVAYYMEQYSRSTLADAVILPHLTDNSAQALTTDHVKALLKMTEGMLAYQPFELVTVHDEFKAHANNMNHVRWQYKEILAEIVDSEVLTDLLNQITGQQGKFTKMSFNLAAQIRESNYALC